MAETRGVDKKKGARPGGEVPLCNMRERVVNHRLVQRLMGLVIKQRKAKESRRISQSLHEKGSHERHFDRQL